MMIRNKTATRRAGLIAFVALLSLAMPLALAGQRRAPRARVPQATLQRALVETPALPTPVPEADAPAPMIRGVLVTDLDPALVVHDGNGYAGPPAHLGPFNAHRTLNLYVVTAMDPGQLGEESFDQVTRFILPDGSTYETRVTPVDPSAEPGSTVERVELAPHPVTVARLVPGSAMAPVMPPQAEMSGVESLALTSVMLPVSGTWITKHNLYGTWTVEVSLVRGGTTFATSSTTFTLGKDY